MASFKKIKPDITATLFLFSLPLMMSGGLLAIGLSNGKSLTDIPARGWIAIVGLALFFSPIAIDSALSFIEFDDKEVRCGGLFPGIRRALWKEIYQIEYQTNRSAGYWIIHTENGPMIRKFNKSWNGYEQFLMAAASNGILPQNFP